MGTTSTSTHERVYKFVVPAEEEDNPRPLDLIGDYGLFPKVKYWSTSIMGQTINEKALNTPHFLSKRNLHSGVRMREVLG